eukprot:TRINITY_DN2808_c0_g1_i1.p1 TRINITY_DN2808_c0_g1~~TRINITY_DN2808_c0_g1_i1.p1  ORF type:complete len:397 (+),score=39.60 TRINITY_DN2808_c0_g1_i1:143-1333(+)
MVACGRLLRGVALAQLSWSAAAGEESCSAADPSACSSEGTGKIWSARAEMYEYTSNANPPMSEVPVRIFPASMHQEGPSRVDVLDLQKELALDYPATAPNLLANYIRVRVGESLPTGVEWATSQSFYVIRGNGTSMTRAGQIDWKEGDLFVLPYLGDDTTPICTTGRQCIKHTCEQEPVHGGCALYWVHDEPLLRYLGVRPSDIRRFEPALYPGEVMKEVVGNISSVTEDGSPRNRRGILLGNPATQQTKTLTPTMWSLLNSIDGKATQHPHKHNSVALDLAVDGGDQGTVYTLLGRELDADGNIVNPHKVEWQSGGVFVTPPGWWHSHHNTGDVTAWVLPIQDAGLYTHQRTLDIRFVEEESARLQKGINRGATSPEMPSGPRPVVAGTLFFGHA